MLFHPAEADRVRVTSSACVVCGFVRSVLATTRVPALPSAEEEW